MGSFDAVKEFVPMAANLDGDLLVLFRAGAVASIIERNSGNSVPTKHLLGLRPEQFAIEADKMGLIAGGISLTHEGWLVFPYVLPSPAHIVSFLREGDEEVVAMVAHYEGVQQSLNQRFVGMSREALLAEAEALGWVLYREMPQENSRLTTMLYFVTSKSVS